MMKYKVSEELIRSELRLMGYSKSDYRMTVTKQGSLLREVDISFTNPAKHLPSSLFKCEDLLILRLHNLEHVPEEIGNLNDLVFLSISRMLSRELPEPLFGLPYLSTLILSRTEVTQISGFSNLPMLTDIDLINNSVLTKFPPDLYELGDLRSLALAGFDESPERMADLLRHLPNLQNLTIGPFQQPLFPDLWYDLSDINIAKLTLAGFSSTSKELDYVPSTINNLSSLEYLWIGGNLRCFPDIPEMKLRELNFLGNPMSRYQRKILDTRKGVCLYDVCPVHGNEAEN